MNTIINFLFAAIKAGTPLLFGTTGEIICQKAGNLNLGVEGMMYMGAFMGFYVGYMTNSPIIALLAAFLIGAFGALIYAFLTVTLQADQNVTGLTLTIFGTGFANFFGAMLVQKLGRSPQLSAEFYSAISSENKLPLLGDIPVVGKLLFSHNVLVYLGIIVAIVVWVYIKHTKYGRNMRAVGENPATADACGINVTAVKYFNIMLGGGICGIGGAYISLINGNSVWNNNCVNGQGWIAVALVIFASWSSAKALVGSLVFGAFTVFQIRANDFATTFPFLSFLNKIPNAIYIMLPFLITAIVLILTSMRKTKSGKQPAHCGINYYREDR